MNGCELGTEVWSKRHNSRYVSMIGALHARKLANEHDYEGKMRGHMKHRRERTQVRAGGGLGAPIRSPDFRPIMRAPMRSKNEGLV